MDCGQEDGREVRDEAVLVEGRVHRQAVEEEDGHDEEDVEEAEGADLEWAGEEEQNVIPAFRCTYSSDVANKKHIETFPSK